MFAVTCAGELEFIYRYTWEHGPAVVDHLLGLEVHVHDHPGGHLNTQHGQTSYRGGKPQE